MPAARFPFLNRCRNRLQTLLPSSCALCGSACHEALCADCRGRYLTLPARRCRQCAHPLPHGLADGIVCGDCLKQPRGFDETVTAVTYAAPFDQILLSLKFGAQLALAGACARLLADAARDRQIALPSLLLPVPLGASRLAERGFNQALEIARPLARALDIPLDPRLTLRVRETAPQSLLPPEERRKNVRNAFTLTPGAIDTIRGRHVGIVDDVMTTGETLDALAAMLKRFGAARVTAFVFARAPH